MSKQTCLRRIIASNRFILIRRHLTIVICFHCAARYDNYRDIKKDHSQALIQQLFSNNLNQQLVASYVLDFPSEKLVEYFVRSLNSIFLKIIDHIYGLLYDLKQKSSHHAFQNLAIKFVECEASDTRCG